MMRKVPVVLMRGGTSKCVVLRLEDAPGAGDERDRFLLRLLGSPDPRQIDGLGGGASTTSKVVMVGPSGRPDADVEYTFAQVSVQEAKVDYRGNCGNCASAVGPFAVQEGLVPLRPPVTEVRIYNTNTRKLIVAEVPTSAGGVREEGDVAIAGVPGTGAGETLWFLHPENTSGHGLLPTGQALDVVPTSLGPVRATFVDAANPVVFAAAEDLGMAGTEVVPLDLWPAAVRLACEQVRGFAAVQLGIAQTPEAAVEVSRNIPKVGMVCRPAAYLDIYGQEVPSGDQDVTARILSMATLHPAFALTGAMALAAAATVPGSIVHAATGGTASTSLRIGHPSGVLSIMRRFGPDGSLVALGIQRTARRLMAGDAFVPWDSSRMVQAGPERSSPRA